MIGEDRKERMGGRISVDYRRCHGCGACVAICLPEAMFLWHSTLAIRIDKCTACNKCLLVCPVNALALLPTGREAAA